MQQTLKNSPSPAEIRERLGSRKVVFTLAEGQAAHSDLETFKRCVELAAASGATHIRVGNLPYRCGSWVLPDHKDPYAAWCNSTPAILRICPPEELHPWVSPEHARECRDFIQQQTSILRSHGLKGVCHTIEPLWLPEEVYRAHPHWRGAQCELGRIASRPYFAPSIDEPEVLDLYRRAMKEFSTQFPEVDFFQFMSNDSGAGVPWTPCIYPGINGPVKHRTRDGGERVADWLKAIQDGAAEAGVRMELNIHSAGFPPELKASIAAKLPSGIFVSGNNGTEETPGGPGASFGGGIWHPAYPVVGMGSPISFLEGLQQIYNTPKKVVDRASVQIGIHDLDLAEIFLQSYFRHPDQGLRENTEALLDAATAFCEDETHAERVIGAWKKIGGAIHATAQVRQKGLGLIFNFATVSSRWLLRPLVADPHGLTPEETAHYRDFIFAAEKDKDNPDLGMILGKSCFNGESAMWMARWALQEAIGTLRGVAGDLQALAAELPKGGAKRVRLLATRTAALACLATNARNCIMFKYSLDIAHHSQYGPNQMDYDDNIIYDQRALNMRKIAREELDNTAELIRLIESTEEPVIEHAAAPEEESVFVLGPNLVRDLRKKMDVMLDHWQDFETLYPTTMVRDFDPAPLSQERSARTATDQGDPPN
ncbi:hypothetical protein [Puniceicoccus vermicola]|uniref:Uncharacterized protein n=1 Tax=Puniceicoccus vermicola TaxID=388746 RepID=A0A7X1B080_9BACT|nr:hypothetical protein [Puniceicoccus vermicola]MBC2603235.1 hypothetical protein [Puniceicoccus vermicola]